MYCSGNSVFKCLSQILKELFVIEQTRWMQTLVDSSAGCIKFLWRCVTVVNRCELYVLTSFGGSTFYTKSFSGFLHVGNKHPSLHVKNLPIILPTREYLLLFSSHLLPFKVCLLNRVISVYRLSPSSTPTKQKS